MVLSPENQAALNDLRFHWDEFYLINYDHQQAEFWARPIGTSRELYAGSVGELRTKIRDDYARSRTADGSE